MTASHNTLQIEESGSPAETCIRKKIVIIGAGMSGMLIAIKLMEAGIHDFEILEKADAIGGTWRDNHYPGLACDVPGYLYTYSFEPNTQCSHRYASGAEIQAYFQRVYRKFGLARYIRFQQEVSHAEFKDNQWFIQTKSGLNLQAAVLVSAVGVLHQPNYPDIPGLQEFQGRAFHSARWEDGMDLKNKRVGVIGTGSTAVQIVSELAGKVEQLVLFQRTPQWVLPAFDKAYTEQGKAVVARFPALARLFHEGYSGFYNSVLGGGFGTERKAFLTMFKFLADRHLNSVKDAELRRKLTPNYRFGCKRFILSDNFYNAMQHPATQLVTEKIMRVEAQGVRTQDDKLHALDVLVLATGFKAQNYVRPIELKGAGGVTLSQHWADGIKAYYSVAIPGFPNFFMLQGPHSPIGNFSLIKIAELQCRYLMQMIKPICTGKLKTVEAREDATAGFNKALREAGRKRCGSTPAVRAGISIKREI